MMVAMQRQKRMLRSAQLGLLLSLLLLAHLGLMAFSHHGMPAAPMVEEVADLPMVVPGDELAATPMVCPGGIGDCMLAWRLPTESELGPALISSLALPDVTALLAAASRPWQLGPYAHGPPKQLSPQLLLQVFRI